MNRLAVPFHGRIIGFPYWNKVGGAAPFSPTDIAGLKLWLKSDAGLYQERTGASATTPASADGDPVGTWLDQSGNANHVTATSDAKRPTLKLAIQNSRNVVRFDGTDDDLRSAAFASALAQPNTLVAIWKTTHNSSTGSVILDGLNAGHRNHFGTSEVSSVRYAATYAGGTDEIRWVRTYPDASFFLVVEIINGASTAGWQNASAITYSSSTPDANKPGSNDLDGVTLGARFSQTFAWGGDLAEVLIYDGALSDTDRGNLQTYLNAKWSLY